RTAAAPADMSCVGCRTYPEEYFPRRDSAIDEMLEERPVQRAPVVLASAEAAEPAAPAERDPALDRLERYSRFAVVAEEQRPASAPTAEATAVQGDELASTE
ncbi:MAG TPA: hypothetical protein VF662_11595, partial [Allosphingosinicella sp.]